MIQPLPVLEISLRKRDAQQYEASLAFIDPNSKVDDRLVAACGPFDTAQYLRREQDSAESGSYGKQIGIDLLGPDSIRAKFIQCRTNAGGPLRVRLFIEPSAPELHSLRWEALTDPTTGQALFSGDQLYLSRYLSSTDYREVKLRAQGALKALVVISNPKDLDQATIQLAPIAVQDEYDRAKAAFSGVIEVTPPAAPAPGSATLDNISAQLRDGAFDILYLVCHGAIAAGPGADSSAEPVLWLENSDGTSNRVTGSQLVAELNKLGALPRLIVLASCQSGGTGKTADVTGALTSLAPRLAAAGVPTVVAMRGNIRMDTVARFMPAFFQSLCVDGSVDRAMAIARGRIGPQDDFWAPVLYSRLRDNCIWYKPGFGDEAGGYQRFPALIESMRTGGCVPILGAGVTENMFGSPREVARLFAEKNGFPLASFDRDNLPTVTQYLATIQGADYMRTRLWGRIGRALLDLHGPRLPPEAATMSLPDLVAAAGAMLRKIDPAEPHSVLASKPFNLYVTTNADTLLEDALVAAGKKPRTDYLRWNEDPARELLIEREPNYKPDKDNPLVFHLLGIWTVPDSLVLTQDDYFDYLLRVSKQNDLIPLMVSNALVSSTLLFLGFRIDDWSFRVLFRSLMAQEGRNLRVLQGGTDPAVARAAGGSRPTDRKPHVAAQIGPEEDRAIDPDRARSYFHEYFQTSDIGLYWGSVADFMNQLLKTEKEASDV